MKIRIASRKSELALRQTRWVAARIWEHRPDAQIEEVHVVTKGDKVLDRPLAAIGGKGLFVSEVEATLIQGEADLAVHSLKDVPGDVDLAEGYDIVCVPAREDPRDVLLTRDGLELDALEAGARVGTTSLRRMAQLKARRPDLDFVNLRGNVGTRLRKLDEGQYDAIVLAAAGLQRLGLLEGRPHRMLDLETCLPAVGQGTLALEARKDDASLAEVLAPLEDHGTRLRTEAERALLRILSGSCRVPIGGHARLFDDGTRLSLAAVVASIDGEERLDASSDVYLPASSEEAIAAAAKLGRDVGASLLAEGARELMVRTEALAIEREQRTNGGGASAPFQWKS